MRTSRIAALLAFTAAPLAAQQPAKLDVELHYATGGDAWVTTNKPAYIAVFDVSRAGVSQLYPVFTEQSEMQAGVERLVNLHAAAPLPAASVQAASSLVALTTPTGPPTFIPRWPHMLLVVASSEPLRVGNQLASNIAINHSLYQEHHFTDNETDQGIAALVDLVRPADPGAEVVLDRIEAISTAVNAGSSYASYDPNKVALGYDCSDGNNEYFAVVPNPGANCVAVRTVPRSLLFPTQNASIVSSSAPGRTDTAVVAKQVKQPDARNVSDPAAIRAFIEAMKPHGANAFKAATEVGGTPATARVEAVAPPERAATVNRRQADPSFPRISAEPRAFPAEQGGARIARPAGPALEPRIESAPAAHPLMTSPAAPQQRAAPVQNSPPPAAPAAPTTIVPPPPKPPQA